VHGLAGLAGRGGGPYTTARAARRDGSRGELGCGASVAGVWPGGQGWAGGLEKKGIAKGGSCEVGPHLA
jgi:hypothetical protein